VLYRPEAALYAVAPSVARQLGAMQLENFHARQGEQAQLDESGELPAAWGRVWGGHSAMSQGGTLDPRYSGTVSGAQVGQDIYADLGAAGQRNHYGVFAGFARSSGEAHGFASGMQDLAVGRLRLDAYSAGGYWTHLAPRGWYADAVLMGTAYRFDPTSRDGVQASAHGHALTASLESGWSLALGHGLRIEPQAQLVWQHLALGRLDDGISSVSFRSGQAVTGRVGVRLAGTWQAGGTTWQPYVRLHVLRTTGADDVTTFGGLDPVGTSTRQTLGQADAGVAMSFPGGGSVYASVSYTGNLAGERQRVVAGRVGLRWSW